MHLKQLSPPPLCEPQRPRFTISPSRRTSVIRPIAAWADRVWRHHLTVSGNGWESNTRCSHSTRVIRYRVKSRIFYDVHFLGIGFAKWIADFGLLSQSLLRTQYIVCSCSRHWLLSVLLSILPSSENDATSRAFSSSVPLSPLCRSVPINGDRHPHSHFRQTLSECVVVQATRLRYEMSDMILLSPTTESDCGSRP